MERLTSKRSWEEAGKELGQEYGYSHIWKRLNQIEDILGDTYDLDRLKEAIKLIDKPGRCVLHLLKAEDEVYIAIFGRVLPFEVTSAVWYGASPTYKAMYGIHLCFVFKQYDIGKTVFLTREAAEAALAKETDHE